MEYPIMETPFVLVPFQEMNKKQAEQYFQWYMTQIDSRIKQLEAYAQRENKHVIQDASKNIILDKTPESLIPLWEWFENHIEYEDMTEEDIHKRILGQPKWIQDILIQNTKKNTIHTLALAEDIAIYFSETIIYNHKEIYWSYKTSPKKLDGVNRPILCGFHHGKLCTNPRGKISVCIVNSSEKKNKYELYETYKIWEKKV